MLKQQQTQFYLGTLTSKSINMSRKYVMNWLLYWLEFNKLIKNFGTIVWDIDDTLVDNEENIIKPTHYVYKEAEKLGFKNVIVTARPDFPHNRKLTEKMLNDNRIETCHHVYMMPSDLNPTEKSISKFKKDSRNEINMKYGRIIAYIGDQFTDGYIFPSKIRGLSHRSEEETAIAFIPGETGVFIKLPGK